MMTMRNNRTMIHPAIQARVDFFEKLESDVKKAQWGNELRIQLEKFVNFCLNLDIGTSFGRIALDNNKCDENLRTELLSNIDMAKSVCLSKREGLSSGSSLTINNTNQQEQVQNLSFQIKEDLRKSLTGEQYDELIDLINKKADKQSITDKIRQFGLEVASGVLASIISSQLI